MISVQNVIKKFGPVTAVNNVSFSVKEGELFALLGPNGAGKSTTIKMLTTLLRPTSGVLELNGHNVVKKQDAARKSFGIVFQDPSVDTELTAYENMTLHAGLYGIPKSEQAQRIEDLLVLVEIWDRRDSLVRTFSGGMKRRLEIARGLLHHPKILFLDEPTLGLDAQTRNLLWEYVQRLRREQKMTVLFTTHYLEEAEANADRIAFIDHGQLITIGTAKELMHQTKTKTLEGAYLQLTGKEIRDQDANSHDNWRERHRAKAMR
jgi:ABC-2 type transport system ATP-binding protein